MKEEAAPRPGGEPADRIYRHPLGAIPPFSFGEEVADVFDDMANRSIPFYREVQRLVVELAARYVTPGSRVYDLGCSTGTTLARLRDALAARGETVAAPPELIGVDSSEAMCDRAREKLRGGRETGGKEGQTANGEQPPVYGPSWKIRCTDILDQRIDDASVVIMNYTLQFIPPLRRKELLDRIYRGLRPGGIVLISDKVLHSSAEVSRLFVELYYDLKRAQGYSELEIAQKREALENVLVPYRFEEERELLLARGFATVETFFTWCNFSSFLCVK